MIKYIFNSIILRAIKIIKIIVCYYIKKFKHKTQISIYFKEQYIEDIYFILLTIAIFILIIYWQIFTRKYNKDKTINS